MLKKCMLIVLCLCLTINHGVAAFGATDYGGDEIGPGIAVRKTWEKDDIGWRYEDKNGNYSSDEWAQIDDHWYYFDSEGYMVTGWKVIAGSVYYFYADPESEGIMASNTIINHMPVAEDGTVDSGGLYELAIPVLDQVGWDLYAAYNWVCKFPYVRMGDSPTLGKAWFAKYGFEQESGNCYVAAATFGTLSELLGYETHMMKGYVPSRTRGMAEHGWLEITVDGETRVYDANFYIETARNGYAINYGQSGTWRYTDYTRMD